jgi:adenine-specific DNA methylase
MLKRLIEVALPLKEVSEQSAREKSIRHGHISTLHIWWARRPLAACRAAAFASLIPDPDDLECPEDFRKLVAQVLDRNEFIPKNGDGSAIADTPRNRCLEFIKHLVKWENTNNPEYIQPARKLIAAAHKVLSPTGDGDSPRVLDQFAGGGAIPLEALRLGCEAFAIDLNPVAHLIELCTLVYPQKYGQPDGRPVPGYIERLLAHNRMKRKKKGEDHPLLKGEMPHQPVVTFDAAEVVPDVQISEADYRRNPLAADVKYWGNWVLEAARRELLHFYPPDPDGSVPVAYLWARTVKSPNPQTPFLTPLFRHAWLTNKSKRKIAFKVVADTTKGTYRFQVFQDAEIDFDPDDGTVKQAKAVCIYSQTTIPNSYLQSEGKAGRIGQKLAAVVLSPEKGPRKYRAANEEDEAVLELVAKRLAVLRQEQLFGRLSTVPDEQIPKTEIRRLSVPLYGCDTFGKLFASRQLLTVLTLAKLVRIAADRLEQCQDSSYSLAVSQYLATIFDRVLDRASTASIWHTTRETIEGAVGRHTLPMTWDFAETNPITGGSGNIGGAVDWVVKAIESAALSSTASAQVVRGMAQQLPIAGLDAIITDPPYYDSVPYSHLADYFYVWLRRILGDRVPGLFSTPLCPKGPEIVQDRPHRLSNSNKTKEFFEAEMTKALAAANQSLQSTGILVLVFAHKTTAAWETLVQSLLTAGLEVTASWPLHTEMTGGMVKTGKAVLASSIFLVCRKRNVESTIGHWDDVRQELNLVARERLDFFWSQGIRGADFFISAIGPALSVFGKYETVTKLSGEKVKVGHFLDEVRGLVSNYALAKILKTAQATAIDPESRFYVVWKWAYGNSKVPAGESFTLSMALGVPTETMWDRTGVLEKAGENVHAMPIAKRMKIKDLGEPNTDRTANSIINVLHRLCVFRERNDTDGMAQFLGRSGQGNNSALWLVAQAISEILPDGDKEKQLMQGLLNQKEKLEQVVGQGRLF